MKDYLDEVHIVTKLDEVHVATKLSVIAEVPYGGAKRGIK